MMEEEDNKMELKFCANGTGIWLEWKKVEFLQRLSVCSCKFLFDLHVPFAFQLVKLKIVAKWKAPHVITCYLIMQHSSPEELETLLLSLLFVDILHQHSLVLEHITLCLHVKVVVHVVINFFCFSVFSKQPSEDSHTSHPDDFFRHTCIGRTLALTITTVPSLLPGFISLTNTSTTVDDLRLLDDQAIFDEFSDILT